MQIGPSFNWLDGQVTVNTHQTVCVTCCCTTASPSAGYPRRTIRVPTRGTSPVAITSLSTDPTGRWSSVGSRATAMTWPTTHSASTTTSKFMNGQPQGIWRKRQRCADAPNSRRFEFRRIVTWARNEMDRIWANRLYPEETRLLWNSQPPLPACSMTASGWPWATGSGAKPSSRASSHLASRWSTAPTAARDTSTRHGTGSPRTRIAPGRWPDRTRSASGSKSAQSSIGGMSNPHSSRQPTFPLVTIRSVHPFLLQCNLKSVQMKIKE